MGYTPITTVISQKVLTPRLAMAWGGNGGAVGQVGPLPATVGAGQVQIVNSPSSLIAGSYHQTLTSASSANAQAGLRTAVFAAVVNNAGFRLRYRFYWGSTHTPGATGQRGFVGFSPNAAAFPTAASNPSALINIIAMAFDATDSNWQIMHNDGSGTATKIDLGASFVINTTDLYELVLDVPSTGTGFTYLVRNFTSGAQASGTVSSSDMPTTAALGLCLCANAAASGAAAQAGHLLMQLECGTP